MSKFCKTKYIEAIIVSLMLLTLITTFSSKIAHAEPAIGPPIGLNIVSIPESASPGQEVNVIIKWWITKDDYKNYMGPFNLHIDLKDSNGEEIGSWTQHVCNYCCGESCPYLCSGSCTCDDPLCECSNSGDLPCCDCLGSSYSCCGFAADENNPYEYSFTRSAPEEVGTYTLEVQILASCLTVIKGNSEHNLLVASEGGEFNTIPEFSTIAIPVAIALMAGLFLFRKQ